MSGKKIIILSAVFVPVFMVSCFFISGCNRRNTQTPDNNNNTNNTSITHDTYNPPKRLFQVDSKAVAKISMANGNTGQRMTITDRKQIDQIVEYINEFRYNRTETYRPDSSKGEMFAPGWGISIAPLDASGDPICSFSPLSENSVAVRTKEENITYYSPDPVKISYEYFEKFFPPKTDN